MEEKTGSKNITTARIIRPFVHVQPWLNKKGITTESQIEG